MLLRDAPGAGQIQLTAYAAVAGFKATLGFPDPGGAAGMGLAGDGVDGSHRTVPGAQPAAGAVDGSVIAAGDNNEGQCNISEWSNIIAIDAVGDRTIGLRADGTVITTGSSYYDCGEVSNWRSISAISAGDYNTAGLQKNGTIIINNRQQSGRGM